MTTDLELPVSAPPLPQPLAKATPISRRSRGLVDQRVTLTGSVLLKEPVQNRSGVAAKIFHHAFAPAGLETSLSQSKLRRHGTFEVLKTSEHHPENRDRELLLGERIASRPPESEKQVGYVKRNEQVRVSLPGGCLSGPDR